MLRKWGLKKPEIISGVEAGEKVVIVDTNNPAELPEGINRADILQIIDHHKLTGGIETAGPGTWKTLTLPTVFDAGLTGSTTLAAGGGASADMF